MHTDELTVTAIANPLSLDRVTHSVVAGDSLADILLKLDLDRALIMGAHIWVGEDYVPAQWWQRVRPKPGQVITVRVVPLGGGGGGKKSPLRTVLQIAVLAGAFAASAYFAGAGLGPAFALGGVEINVLAALSGPAVGLVGGLLVDAIAPPPNPSLGGLTDFSGQRSVSPNFTIEGARNEARPWSVIPRNFGRNRMAPPIAALTYTESVGNEQYLRLLLTFGYGPNRVTDLKIGDTDLDNYAEVDYEIREGWPTDDPLTLYTQDVYEEALSILLEQSTGWVVRTSQLDADEVTTDIVFPRGLVEFNDNGDRQRRTVTVEVEISPAGQDDWQPAQWAEPSLSGFGTPGRIVVTGAAPDALRMGGRVKVETGQYDMRWRRQTADTDDDQIFDEVYVAALRTIKYQAPVNLEGLTLLAVRLKATDQLNGVVDRLTGLVESYLPVYDGSSWSHEITRNPAWAYTEVLRGAANLNPMADDRLRLADFQAWAAANEAAGWHCDAVIDFDTTVNRLLDQIASTGRAARGMVDSQHTVIRDEVQTVPVQHFTPRNSWGFRSRKRFQAPPHALAVRFANEEADYRQDSRTVYRDGYDETNASDIEETDYFGITEPDMIWTRARIDMATGDLRPEVYELNVDIEHLVATRGDLVRVAHDVTLWGRTQGRVKDWIDDGAGAAIALIVDEVCAITGGGTFSVEVRLPDNSSQIRPVTSITENGTRLNISPPIGQLNAGSLPGCLFMFGETDRETVDLKILRIEQRGDLAARIELVDAAPEIDDAITGPIPAFDSQITRPAPLDSPIPRPRIASVASDEKVLIAEPGGAWRSQILVTFDPIDGDLSGLRLAFLDGQYRLNGVNTQWQGASSVDVDATQLSITAVDDGETYDLRFRYVAQNGAVSQWSYVNDYRVIGKTTPPPDPGVLYVERLASNVNLRPRYRYRLTDYDAPRDHAGFVYRWQPGQKIQWPSAKPFGPQPVVDDNFEADALIDTTFTVMVKAVDQAGNESVNFSYAIVEGPKPIDPNVLSEVDYKAAGWPGTHNGIIDGDGNLVADSGGPFFTDPAAPLFTDPDAPIIGDFQELRYEFRYQAPFWGTFNLNRTVSVAHDLRYALAGSGLFFSDPNAPLFDDPDAPLFTSAEDVPPVDFVGPFLLTEAPLLVGYLTARGGADQAVISDLKAIVEPETFSEYVADHILPSGGGRVPLANQYSQLLSVVTDVQAHGSQQAVVIIVEDKDPINGPFLRGERHNGANAEALVDCTVIGIPLHPSGQLST